MKHSLNTIMKALWTALAFTAFTAGAAAPAVANAEAVQTSPSFTAQVWVQYESTAREIRRLSRKLNTRDVVKTVDSVLTKVIQETVTERQNESSHQSASAGLSDLLISFSGRYDSSSSKSWDVSKMIVQNAAEVANFDRREADAMRALQEHLLDYIENNEVALIRLKELGIMNLSAAHALIKAGEKVPREEVQATAAIAKELSFFGQHNVTRCVKTEFAARSRSSESSTSASIGGRLLFLTFSAKGSMGSKAYWEQIPHTVTECQSSTNRIAVTPESAVYIVSFSRLDRLVDSWIEAVELAYLAGSDQVPFPTWGSPYYQ